MVMDRHARAVLALAAVPAIVTIHSPGVAKADVRESAGRRVSVSGCANIADAVAPYVHRRRTTRPCPTTIAAPNVNGCVSYNGRWVNAARSN